MPKAKKSKRVKKTIRKSTKHINPDIIKSHNAVHKRDVRTSKEARGQDSKNPGNVVAMTGREPSPRELWAQQQQIMMMNRMMPQNNANTFTSQGQFTQVQEADRLKAQVEEERKEKKQREENRKQEEENRKMQAKLDKLKADTARAEEYAVKQAEIYQAEDELEKLKEIERSTKLTREQEQRKQRLESEITATKKQLNVDGMLKREAAQLAQEKAGADRAHERKNLASGSSLFQLALRRETCSGYAFARSEGRKLAVNRGKWVVNGQKRSKCYM